MLSFIGTVGLLLAVTTLGEYADDVRTEVEGQVSKVLKAHSAPDHLVGTVSLVADDCIFLQGEEDAMKVICGDTPSVVPGARVEVVGRPSLEGGRVVFLAESVGRNGTATLPAAQPVKGGDLLKSDAVNWRRVELQGRAMGLTESGFAMDIDGVPVTVFAQRLPEFMSDCDETRPLVKVTGVVELVLDQSTLFGRAHPIIGVKHYVASAEDVVLVPDLRYRMNCRDRKTRLGVMALFVLLGAALLMLIGLVFRQARRQFRASTLMRERKRMADDLHDTIEQHLVGVGMLMQLGRVKEARDILVRAKREMRDIVWGLKNDDMMRLTPAEMIREYAQTENKKGVSRIETKLSGLPDRLDASQMRDLSLIIREAVGNAIKHGGARKIAVTCDPREGGGWLMRIANDGSPFDPSKAPGAAEGHFGLEGMRERARRLKAELRIAARGRWTVVELECASN